MMLGEGSQALATLGDAIKAVMAHEAELALLDRQQARQTAAIAALLGGCLLAFVLTRSLTLPLQPAVADLLPPPYAEPPSPPCTPCPVASRLGRGLDWPQYDPNTARCHAGGLRQAKKKPAQGGL